MHGIYLRNMYQIPTITINRTTPIPITVMLLISLDSFAMVNTHP